MRPIAVSALVAVAGVLLLQAPAEAQVSSSKNPWCMRDGTFGRGSWDCSYHNLRQCLESASGLGGTCQPNPNYRPRGQSQRTDQPKRWDRY